MKATQHLTKSQAANINEAVNHAARIELPLNYSATIHWALAGGIGTARERQKALFEKVRHWLERRNVPWTTIWVREAGEHGKEVHTHLALHLPPHRRDFVTDRRLPSAFEAYLREHLDGDLDTVLDFGPVTREGGSVGRWTRYLLKGVKAKHWDTFRIAPINRKPQGLVAGLRGGTSRNIGRAARERALHQALADRRRIMATRAGEDAGAAGRHG